MLRPVRPELYILLELALLPVLLPMALAGHDPTGAHVERLRLAHNALVRAARG